MTDNEKEFIELFKRHCPLITWKEATTFENMFKHFDVKVKGEKEKISLIEVKGLKSDVRGLPVNPLIHWLEFINVLGNTGWVYGSATHFAFEIDTSWIILKKKTLRDYVTKLNKTITDKTIYRENTKEKPLPYYKLYQRKGKKDLTMKIPSKDLIDISDYILEK